MTRGTRAFLAGSAVVTVLGLGTGLVAYYNGSLPLGLGADQADQQLAYLPADAVAVGFADMQAVMRSEFHQKLHQTMPVGEGLAGLRDELGVDMERDIDSVAGAWLGAGPDSRSGVVVVRGRFNDGRIETLATQHGAVVSDYHGTRVLTMRPEAQATAAAPATGLAMSVAAVAFLEPGVLALGEESAVRQAIDAGGSGRGIRDNRELMAMIDDVRGNGHAWFVGHPDAMTAHAGVPSGLSAQLPPLGLMAASIRMDGGVSGQVRADARDDKAAEQLRDMIKGALAAGRLMTEQDPRMAALFDSLQIVGSGRSVSLTFTVPAELLDAISAAASGAPGPVAGAGAPIHK